MRKREKRRKKKVSSSLHMFAQIGSNLTKKNSLLYFCVWALLKRKGMEDENRKEQKFFF